MVRERPPLRASTAVVRRQLQSYQADRDRLLPGQATVTLRTIAAVAWAVLAVGRLGAQGAVSPGEQVLAAARQRMGGTAAITAVRSLVAIADCEGPKRSYRTIVRSDRNGAVEFEQDFTDGTSYRVAYEGQRPPNYIRRPRTLSQTELANRAQIQGHEIHMIVLAPDSRFGGPDSVRDTVFRGRRAVAVAFHDGLGAPVAEYFATRDSLPLGFTFPDREVARPGEVSLVLSQWRRVDGILMPHYAVFWQAGKAYRFRFTSIRLNPLSKADSINAAAGLTRAGRGRPLPGP
jgi:hypothetical protein